MFVIVSVFVATICLSVAAPQDRAVTELVKTTSSDNTPDIKSIDDIGDRSKEKKEGSGRKDALERLYGLGMDELDRIEETKRTKPPCGPIRFPEMSCEEQETTPATEMSIQEFNLDDLLEADGAAPEISNKNDRAPTPTAVPATYNPTITSMNYESSPTYYQPPAAETTVQQTTTLVTLQKRVTKTYKSYYRNVPPRTYRRPPYRMYRFRQLRENGYETSSTMPFGWESTPTTPANLPEACIKFAKCEPQIW